MWAWNRSSGSLLWRRSLASIHAARGEAAVFFRKVASTSDSCATSFGNLVGIPADQVVRRG